jgi:hypothetical protein
MTILPRGLFKGEGVKDKFDYLDLFKAVGHDEAFRQLRARVVCRHGHHYFAENREKIGTEAERIERHQ